MAGGAPAGCPKILPVAGAVVPACPNMLPVAGVVAPAPCPNEPPKEEVVGPVDDPKADGADPKADGAFPNVVGSALVPNAEVPVGAVGLKAPPKPAPKRPPDGAVLVPKPPIAGAGAAAACPNIPPAGAVVLLPKALVPNVDAPGCDCAARHRQ